MPEGDSVLQLSERMQWMCGRTITHTDIRVPRYATVTFDAQTVARVWPYGKHLFIQIGGSVVHTHLKMEGVWSIHAWGTRWRRPGHSARIVLRFAPQYRGGAEIEVVGHWLGFVRIFPVSHYAAVVANLGPDILSSLWLPQQHGAETVPERQEQSERSPAVHHDWDGRSGRDESVRRVLLRPRGALGAALVDQYNVAGIGNEYRAEIMFLCGLHPAIPVGVAGRQKVEAVLDMARAVMWDNRLQPRRVFTGDRREGMGNYVFGRSGRECRRCGSRIEEATLGGRFAGGDPQLDGAELERIIWWCPRCQPYSR